MQTNQFTLRIARNDGTSLFELDGQNALAPLDQGERAEVFYALTQALEVLAGIRPQPDIFSKAEFPAEPMPPTVPDHADRRFGVVVPLRGQWDT